MLGIGALSVYHGRFVADERYDFFSSFRFPWAVGFVAALVVCAYALGIPGQRPSRGGAWVGALGAVAAGAVFLSICQLVVGSPLLPRLVILGASAVLVPWFVLCCRLADDVSRREREQTRVIVVGDLADVSPLWIDLETSPERPATVVGMMTPDEARLGPTVRPLIDAVVATGANLVVLDRFALAEATVVRQAARLHERGVRVRSLSEFSAQWMGKLPASELERASLMFDIAEVHGGRYAPVKRVIDVACGLACLVLAVAVAPLVALANVVGDSGPLLYRQPRVGKGGAVFMIVKFRTMRVNGAPTTWTTQDDPRITRVGRLLRRAHLDELPQGWNILRGELSIVGPRPEQPEYVAELSQKLPFYGMRHLVRPGLTGWAQVKYGYAGDNADALEKLQYEFHYLERQSLSFDLRIMARTARSVFGGAGAGR